MLIVYTWHRGNMKALVILLAIDKSSIRKQSFANVVLGLAASKSKWVYYGAAFCFKIPKYHFCWGSSKTHTVSLRKVVLVLLPLSISEKGKIKAAISPNAANQGNVVPLLKNASPAHLLLWLFLMPARWPLAKFLFLLCKYSDWKTPLG